MSDDRTTLPEPVLRGDNDQRRKWAEKIASGAKIPAIPEGERGVSFVLTPGDARAFEGYVMRKRWLFWLSAFLLPTVLLTWTVISGAQRKGVSPFGAVLKAIPIILLPVFVFAVFMLVVRYFANKNAAKTGLFDPITISVSPEFITNQSAVAGMGKVPWRMIKNCNKTTRHIFFQLQDNRGYVIPLWAFDAPNDADFFFEEAKGYWEQSKPQGKA